MKNELRIGGKVIQKYGSDAKTIYPDLRTLHVVGFSCTNEFF
jgi:hypothetical protein